MTEITVKTFKSNFNLIAQCIQEADFVCIDTEFTGLAKNSVLSPSLFDTPKERYAKVSKCVQEFTVCQLGITTFCQSKTENKYLAHTFAFYLCQRPLGVFDPSFSVQRSSLEFLCETGFDFNKFIYDGLSYANSVEQDFLQKEIKSLHLPTSPSVSHDRVVRQLAVQLSSLLRNIDVGKTCILSGLPTFNTESIAIRLMQINDNCIIFIDDQNKSTVVARKLDTGNSEHMQERKRMLVSLGEKMFEIITEFNRVFDLIVSSKKPIVGHNAFLDLLFIYNMFHEPLPRAYNQFKREMHRLFPEIFDTKHITMSMKQSIASHGCKDLLDSGDLLHLYNVLRSAPGALLTMYSPHVVQLENPNGFSTRHHDAGFDSYAAGFVFIKLAHILASKQREKFKCAESSLMWKEHLSAVLPFLNKVNLIRAQSHHLQMDSSDPTSDRPAFLCVQPRDPSQTCIDDDKLKCLLSRYGSVDLRPISSRAYILAVGSKGCEREIVAALKESDFRISKYSLIHHSRCFRWLLLSCLVVSVSVSAICGRHILRSGHSLG